MEWLFWLLTLNSVVNPWIYMFFNRNLVESLAHLCYCNDTSTGSFRPSITSKWTGGRRHQNPNRSSDSPDRIDQGFVNRVNGLTRPRSNTTGSNTSMTLMATTTTSMMMTSVSTESLKSSNGTSAVVIVEPSSKGSRVRIVQNESKMDEDAM